MWLFITPFSICFVGVAQLTLGRIVSVSLACPVRWLVNLCLHCNCTFSFSLCVTNCLSDQLLWLCSQLQPCLLSSIFISSTFILSSSPSCSEIYLKTNVSVFHQHVVTTFSFYQRSMHICPWAHYWQNSSISAIKRQMAPLQSSHFENECSNLLLPNWSISWLRTCCAPAVTTQTTCSVAVYAVIFLL